MSYSCNVRIQKSLNAIMFPILFMFDDVTALSKYPEPEACGEREKKELFDFVLKFVFDFA